QIFMDPLIISNSMLLKIAKGQRTYKVRFVIDVSELGEFSPLLQNATTFPEFQSISWYRSIISMYIAFHDFFLAHYLILLVESFSISLICCYQTCRYTSRYYCLGCHPIPALKYLFDHSSVCANDQIQWLTRILKESDSEWKVVFGECKILKMENGSPFEPLWSILLQYGENAYISTKSCTDQGQRFGVSSMDRGSYFTAVNQNFVFKEDKADGFIFHRISSLEMVSYGYLSIQKLVFVRSVFSWHRKPYKIIAKGNY
ncbi:calcineurin-like metallo-phosphoesterase super family protein, partial [Striga asiatica]